jgi:hypothetical protein
MSDRIFLRLCDKYALGADDLQWILCRRHQRQGKPDTWDGISFVSSTKDILLRCIRESGCVPDGTAAAALESMPSTFAAWKAAVPSPSTATMALEPEGEPA